MYVDTLVVFFVFFFKQKTEYDFPKRDWSSDVCSSDIGWIMGPWTIVSAGALGARLCLCEGGPTTPGPDRLWKLVEREGGGVPVVGGTPRRRGGLVPAAAAPASPERLRWVRTIGAPGEPMTPAPYRW